MRTYFNNKKIIGANRQNIDNFPISERKKHDKSKYTLCEETQQCAINDVVQHQTKTGG